MDQADWNPVELAAFWSRERFPLKHDSIWWAKKCTARQEKPLPDWETHEFFRYLRTHALFQKGDHILDIGCGLGAYSLVLAQHGGFPVGIDFAAPLIEGAKQLASKQQQEHPQSNPVTFSVQDWDQTQPAQEGFEKQFDLVFAHCSPAVDQSSAIDKMIQCSRRSCCIVKPCRTFDPLLTEVRKQMARPQSGEGKDLQLPLTLAYLLQLGFHPSLEWTHQTWELTDTPDKLFLDLKGRLEWRAAALSREEEHLLQTQVAALPLQNDRIHYPVHVSIAYLHWNVNTEPL